MLGQHHLFGHFMKFPVPGHIGRVVLCINLPSFEAQIHFGDGHGHGGCTQGLGQNLKGCARWHAHFGARQVTGLFNFLIVVQVDGAGAQISRVQNHQAHFVGHILVILFANVTAKCFDQVIGIAEQICGAEHAVFGQLGLNFKGHWAGHLQIAALHGGQLSALAKQSTCRVHRYLDGPWKLGFHARFDGSESIGQGRGVGCGCGHPDFGLGLGCGQCQGSGQANGGGNECSSHGALLINQMTR